LAERVWLSKAARMRATKMFLPETYQAALLLMILTMLCWGSWANTLKLCPGYRFQLFYWDYALDVYKRQGLCLAESMEEFSCKSWGRRINIKFALILSLIHILPSSAASAAPVPGRNCSA